MKKPNEEIFKDSGYSQSFPLTAREDNLMDLARADQDELAKQIGVDRRKVMALESGKQDLETLILCCDFYDIEINGNLPPLRGSNK